MHGQKHSYLDLSVLKELRKNVLSANAVVVFNDEVDEIIWANAAGAQLFGGRGVVDLLSTKISDSQTIINQIKDTIEQMQNDKSVIRGFRVNQGLQSLLIQFEIKRIALSKDDHGYKVTNRSDNKDNISESNLAFNAVATLEGFADAAAILDGKGKTLSASSNFKELGPTKEVLSSLVNELKDEKDRLIKRPEENSSGNLVAIGLARLSKKPSRNLIVLASPDKQIEAEDAVVEDENISNEKEIAASNQSDQLAKEYEDTDLINSIFDDTTISEDETSTPLAPDFEDEPEEENATSSAEQEPIQQRQFEFEKEEGTIRFAWVIDEKRIFQSVSPELADTVGDNAAAIIGREWREVANVFGFDTNREIETLLNKQDTWSGKTVLWPVQGTDMVLPIDLAALPSFNSDREFGGFRGFGIIRTADAMLDPDETGLALTAQLPVSDEDNKTSDVDSKDETTPSLTPDSSNIVRLVPRDFSPVKSTLSEQESYAFRKIGDTLRKDTTKATSAEEIKKALQKTEPKLVNNEVVEIQDATSQDKNSVTENPKITAFRPAGLDTSIMENLPVAIIVYNSEEILFTNQSFLEASGYSTTLELEEAGGIESILMPLSNEDKTVNYCLTTKDGERKPINPVLHTVPWGGEKALLISFPSAGLQAESIDQPPALEMSSVSEIQNILDITSDGILVLEPTGSIVSINASAEALFNTTFDQAKDTDITSLFATESRNSIRHYVENIASPNIKDIFDDGQEVIAAEANGGMIPVFLTISRMQSSGKLCAVIRDMTSWKKAEEELIQSRHEAEKSSNHKTDFLANISHEIRTPLNSIIGFSDIMIEERFGPVKNERYREYLRDINRSGNHVLELINDLLDLSKIEAGKLELEFEAVELNELVSETVALLQPQANENRIIIRTSLSRAVPKVVADTRSIRQIILNLVSNAIKFSPTNSQVIVSTVYESNGEVALRIRDTGHGMSDTQIEDALKPFQQVHQNKNVKNEGTGLGLSLTKALVEANRALFDLESEPGQGTTAHVQFPTQRVLAD